MDKNVMFFYQLLLCKDIISSFNGVFQAKPDSPDQHYVPTSKFGGESTNQRNRNSIDGQVPAHAGGTQVSPRNIGSETSSRTKSRVRSITPDHLLHDDG